MTAGGRCKLLNDEGPIRVMFGDVTPFLGMELEGATKTGIDRDIHERVWSGTAIPVLSAQLTRFVLSG